MTRQPRVAVLDTNAIDVVADTPGLLDDVQSAIDDGCLRLLWTHITRDELTSIGDLGRRERLLGVAQSVADLVPTGAFVLGVSRLDAARLNDDVAAFETYRKSTSRDTNDALISITAEVEGAALSTRDVTMISRAAFRHMVCVDPADLAVWAREVGRVGSDAQLWSLP